MANLQVLLAFVLSFSVVAIVTPLIRLLALRWKLGDKPNGRNLHTSTIPHLGGIGMVAGVVLTLVVIGRFFGFGETGSSFFYKLAVPVSLIVVLGLADDIRNLRARQKLTIQIIASTILAVSGVHLYLGFETFDTNILAVILLTSFYLVGTSSSVNLIDGHDGVAAGVSLISAAAFAVLAWIVGASHLVVIALALSGVCLGFLIYNFPPGRIFMGDAGSMFLGIVLGAVACGLSMAQPAVTTFVAVCLVLAIPTLDALLAIARRLFLRRPVFLADHQHIHHILSSFGFTARQTVVILYSLQAVMACLGVLAMSGYVIPIVAGGVVFVLLFVGFFRLMVVAKQRSHTVSQDLSHGSVPSLEK
ncbi:MAG: MraY family glycosyltransferase [bacterium]|nr:MraY family glycosyltransferase [bacterium]